VRYTATLPELGLFGIQRSKCVQPLRITRHSQYCDSAEWCCGQSVVCLLSQAGNPSSHFVLPSSHFVLPPKKKKKKFPVAGEWAGPPNAKTHVISYCKVACDQYNGTFVHVPWIARVLEWAVLLGALPVLAGEVNANFFTPSRVGRCPLHRNRGVSSRTFPSSFYLYHGFRSPLPFCFAP